MARQYFTLRFLLLSEAHALQWDEIFPLHAQGKSSLMQGVRIALPFTIDSEWMAQERRFPRMLLTSAQESAGHSGIWALKTLNDVAAAAQLAVESSIKQTLQKKVHCA